MNIKNVRKILGAFKQHRIIRLADLSGVTNWYKSHRLNQSGTAPLPYKFDALDLRQREMFSTAKTLQSYGLLRIYFKAGENWFAQAFEDPSIPDLSPLGGENA